MPAITISRRTLTLSGRQREAVERFVHKATDQSREPSWRSTSSRAVLVSIINEAAWAAAENVASATDINTALKLGTNYPKGPWSGPRKSATPPAASCSTPSTGAMTSGLRRRC